MDRDALTQLRRVVRDPFTVLLGTAAAVQVALATSAHLITRPGLVVAAVAAFALVGGLAVAGRMRDQPALRTAAPFVLLAVAACWRAADRYSASGFGVLAIVAVVWLAFYGTRQQVWIAVAGVVILMIGPPLLLGDGLSADDWRRTVLTLGVAVFVGPTIQSLVARSAQADARVSLLEPVGSQHDAILRAATAHLIIVTDPEGLIVEFNPGAEKMLGWRSEEVVGHHTPQLFHAADEVARRAAELGVVPGFEMFTDAARRGEVETRDWTLVGKDGRRVTVSLTISAMHDTAGVLTGFVGIGTDVTESRAAMASLAAQREIYGLLVEHLPLTTVGLFDDRLQLLTIGGHWLATPGRDAAALVGRPAEEFFAEADRVRVREMYEQARTQPVQVEMDLADGRSFEFAALPVPGPNGEPLVLSLARDISERRRAELERQQMVAALAVSEAGFREAFEGAPIGMALTTLEGAPAERFLRVNPAFAAILGRQPEDLVGMVVADVTHPEDVLLQPNADDPVTSATLRKRFLRPSGRAVWVDVSYAIVRDQNGKPAHVVKQIQDINTIRQSERALLDALEQQRAATASLREIDKIRTDLVGTISHELRTPLTSVRGYLELLADEPLTAPQHAMLEVAVRNSERLASLVDSLLVIIRLDAAEPSSVNDVDVLIGDTLGDALDTVRPEFTARRQSLDVCLRDRTAVVHGDSEQLERVLVNLLNNASKYTPVNGRVEVDVARVGQCIEIAISDTGVGIPADEQEHLFTRFFRASTARSNAISGNGLGLAIVKSIVERHDGSVTVESVAGTGSRFTVTLPLVAPATPATAATA